MNVGELLNFIKKFQMKKKKKSRKIKNEMFKNLQYQMNIVYNNIFLNIMKIYCNFLINSIYSFIKILY